MLTGNLTYNREPGSDLMYLRFPNFEVRKAWQLDPGQIIISQFGWRYEKQLSVVFHDEKFEVEQLEIAMRDCLEKSNYYERASEDLYLAYYCAAFMSALCGSPDAYVETRLCAGNGPLDILISLNRMTRIYFIEFRRSIRKQSLEEDADAALQQIKAKKYDVEIVENKDCKGSRYYIGVSFCKGAMSKLHWKVNEMVAANEKSAAAKRVSKRPRAKLH